MRLDAYEIAQNHGVPVEEVKQIFSKPAGGGIIRVMVVRVKNTRHIYDGSENSEGYQKVVGQDQYCSAMEKIYAASKS